MRFIVIVKASEQSESGAMPTQEGLAQMQEFNEGLVKGGAMLAGEGLLPSSKGARIRFSGGKQTVIDGPFAGVRELVAGFWIIQAESLHEAINFMKRAPFETGAEIEIRPIAEVADFGEAMTPEMREAEERMASQMASNVWR